MCERLNKRPKLVEGESLSGYFMRTAFQNHISTSDMVERIAKSTLKGRFGQLDGYPQQRIDFNLLSQMTEVNEMTLLNASLIPIYEKFLGVSNKTPFDSESFRSTISAQFELNLRRFCPACTNEFKGKGLKGVYKQIWQIKQIKICNIHREILTSECIKCGALQPFVATGLGDYCCYNCGESLCYHPCEGDYNVEFINNQNKLYSYWGYILDCNKNGLISNEKLNYKMQMVITLMFIIHKNTQKDCNSFRFGLLTKYEKKNLIASINSVESHLYLTPHILFKILERGNCTADEFFSTIVDDSFINSIHYLINPANKPYGFSRHRRSNSVEVKHKRELDEIKLLIDDYVGAHKFDKKLSLSKVYTSLRISRMSIPKDAIDYLSEKVREHNQNINNDVLQKVKDSIIELYKEGESISYVKIAEKARLHVSYIKRNPEIIRLINKVKNDI